DEAVQIHAVSGAQVIGQAGGAEHAITFAAEVLRREPAVMARGPETDEIADGIHVAGDAKETVGLLFLGGAAETGGHGINEYKVAGIEHGKFVVHQREGRRGLRAVGIHFSAARSESAEVQPEGGGAGSAVEAEGDGSR